MGPVRTGLGIAAELLPASRNRKAEAKEIRASISAERRNGRELCPMISSVKRWLLEATPRPCARGDFLRDDHRRIVCNLFRSMRKVLPMLRLILSLSPRPIRISRAHVERVSKIRAAQDGGCGAPHTRQRNRRR